MLVVCGRRFFLRSWSLSGSAMGLLGFGLLLVFGAKPSKSRCLCILGGGAVGLWSQLKCICGGPPSPLHRGPSILSNPFFFY